LGSRFRFGRQLIGGVLHTVCEYLPVGQPSRSATVAMLTPGVRERADDETPRTATSAS
jgi:hypothetical protein